MYETFGFSDWESMLYGCPRYGITRFTPVRIYTNYISLASCLRSQLPHRWIIHSQSQKPAHVGHGCLLHSSFHRPPSHVPSP